MYYISFIQSVKMRKSSSFAELAEVRRKVSKTQGESSLSSSKYQVYQLRLSLSQCQSIASGLRPAKGFSFGGSRRDSFLITNVSSPSAKYNIKGVVEINLNNKKGPSFGSGRENSVDKTPLSYIPATNNVLI